MHSGGPGDREPPNCLEGVHPVCIPGPPLIYPCHLEENASHYFGSQKGHLPGGECFAPQFENSLYSARAAGPSVRCHFVLPVPPDPV